MILKELFELREQLKSGKIGKSEKSWGGANLIITTLTNSPYELAHSKKYPQDLIIRTEYHKEYSWLIFELKSIFSTRVDSLNKYEFYSDIGNLIIDSTKIDKNIIDKLIFVVEGMEDYIHKYQNSKK